MQVNQLLEVLILEVKDSQRLTVVIALEDVGAHIPDSLCLTFVLNTLYADVLLDGVSKHRDSRYERAVERDRVHIVYESLIDLDLIDRKLS